MTNVNVKDQVAEALREALATMKHAVVFISSREKMHPDGISLHLESIKRAEAALTAPVPEAPVSPEYAYARNLLLALHAKHYGSPDFEALPDLEGVLTQIDNLTTGLARVPESPGAEQVHARWVARSSKVYLTEQDAIDAHNDVTWLIGERAHLAAALSTARATIGEQAATMVGLRAIAEATEVAGWQPIETAPRDGTWFVIGREGEPDFYEVGCYDPSMGYTYDEVDEGLYRGREFVMYEWNKFSNFHRATHWQPLPPPPKEGSET